MKQRAAKIITMVLTCDAAMKRGVFYWRQAVAQENPQAFEYLQRAARLPYRLQNRIQEGINRFGASTINQWLSDNQLPSLGQLATQLQPYLDYSDLLRDRYQNQGWTEEQIATDIETNREDIDLEDFPLSAGYTDDL